MHKDKFSHRMENYLVPRSGKDCKKKDMIITFLMTILILDFVNGFSFKNLSITRYWNGHKVMHKSSKSEIK